MIKSYHIKHGNIFAIPIIHYNMEMAGHVKIAFSEIQPDCVAVELAETMQLQLLHAASRLPDISVVTAYNKDQQPLHYLSEPCDSAFEALRSGLEAQIPSFCIDLDTDSYPDVRDDLPDPYSMHRIGLKAYYELYKKHHLQLKFPQDHDREMYMAKRLKELSLSYDRVFFVGGMLHIESILNLIQRSSFPILKPAQRQSVEIATLTEQSCREVMAECGWVSSQYEINRQKFIEKSEDEFPPDRQKVIYQLYKKASEKYTSTTGQAFRSYHMRNIMKFARNYSLITNRLMPDLFQILSAAKGCVDHNYAYEVWELATEYPYRKNIDGLQEKNLTVKEIWGHNKMIKFQLKQQGRKQFSFSPRRKDKSNILFKPPSLFSLCSHPPEDLIIEQFGDFLRKKGAQVLLDEQLRSVPFSTSLEEGIDIKETIHHWAEKKLYVKVKGKPPGGVGSISVIFDEDKPVEGQVFNEKYPWKMTWIGEHAQESDMSFYSTSLTKKIVGPGISQCEYGGFMMSYPPRRMMDIWTDSDYEECRTKAEVLLMAAIDYAVKPLIVYVASQPPRPFFKNFANRFGKKIIYIPIGQLSPNKLNKMRIFHVLDGYDKRKIADEYIF